MVDCGSSGSGPWALGSGLWELWKLEFGLWVLEFGLWVLGFGLWDSGFGLWDLSSLSSNSSPAGLTARSTCHSALRRSFVNAFNAPISASVVSSSRRRPVRWTTSS